ncbi:MAG: hypothetical protein QG670_953 [Thermoproteota archaeon]|nr:hypothetical protein [Thermoproteota archaeon]
MYQVMNLLQRRAKSPGEAYIVCKLLVLFFENNYDLKMDPQDEKMLMDLVKETLDLKDEVNKQSNEKRAFKNK